MGKIIFKQVNDYKMESENKNKNQLIELNEKLTDNDKMIIDVIHLREVVSPEVLPGGLPLGVIDLYESINGYTLNWQHTDYKDVSSVGGLCRILSRQEIKMPLQGIVWFDSTAADDPIRNFIIIDFFIDEACAGVYKDANDNAVYFYEFESKPRSLNLDIDGYITMLCLARCFRFWQTVLIFIATGEERQEVNDFKKYMPLLFPDFNYDEFVSVYNSVKLK
jgi:hypothetical protein